jgi:hypothetical protein
MAPKKSKADKKRRGKWEEFDADFAMNDDSQSQSSFDKDAASGGMNYLSIINIIIRQQLHR